MSFLLPLALTFSRLSLLAVGGVNSTLPEMSRLVVTVKHWITPAQFSQFYAIANVAPGPNLLIVTVIGAHLAGVWGGLVATAAMMLPAGIIAAFVAVFFNRHKDARFLHLIQVSLLPLSAGLVLAAASLLARQSDTGWLTALLTLVAAFLTWRTKLHPLWLLGAGAAIGILCL